ncbi:hypothetical protein [Mesorhizobium xinjiangense]|uniref:hypothetical protein n=1 Tax=Mesorhizobium xinjiangense TaxID=2678685 RepID=UPI001F2C3068|nr:hypothetical protein [Mesorhizobium xinjiangense]
MTQGDQSAFPSMLHYAGPAPDLAEKLALYGRFIGDWTMDVLAYDTDGSTREATGSIHFGWVLQGRAIQDIWRIPGYRPGQPDDTAQSYMFGTTLRVFDPALDAWHIIWADPVRQFYSTQIGRAAGRDIVQEGTDGKGVANRWSFTEITDHSFHWIGEHAPGGEWSKTVEFFVRRAGLSASTTKEGRKHA